MRLIEPTDAILEQLRLLDANSEQPISLYAIGVPLIGAGYSQDQILNALFYLESHKKIELVPGNLVRMVSGSASPPLR